MRTNKDHSLALPLSLLVGTLLLLAAPIVANALELTGADYECVPVTTTQCGCGRVMDEKTGQCTNGTNKYECICSQGDPGGGATTGTCAATEKCLALETNGKAPSTVTAQQEQVHGGGSALGTNAGTPGATTEFTDTSVLDGAAKSIEQDLGPDLSEPTGANPPDATNPPDTNNGGSPNLNNPDQSAQPGQGTNPSNPSNTNPTNGGANPPNPSNPTNSNPTNGGANPSTLPNANPAGPSNPYPNGYSPPGNGVNTGGPPMAPTTLVNNSPSSVDNAGADSESESKGGSWIDSALTSLGNGINAIDNFFTSGDSQPDVSATPASDVTAESGSESETQAQPAPNPIASAIDSVESSAAQAWQDVSQEVQTLQQDTQAAIANGWSDLTGQPNTSSDALNTSLAQDLGPEDSVEKSAEQDLGPDSAEASLEKDLGPDTSLDTSLEKDLGPEPSAQQAQDQSPPPNAEAEDEGALPPNSQPTSGTLPPGFLTPDQALPKPTSSAVLQSPPLAPELPPSVPESSAPQSPASAQSAPAPAPTFSSVASLTRAFALGAALSVTPAFLGNTITNFADTAQASAISAVAPASSAYLVVQRAPLMAQLNTDPALRSKVIAVIANETNNSTAAQAILESMVNRSVQRGYTSLNQAINDGFYGPVNSGAVNSLLKSGLNQGIIGEGNQAIAAVAGGSNICNFCTDQGQSWEISGPAQNIGGEYFGNMAGDPKWANQQRQLQTAYNSSLGNPAPTAVAQNTPPAAASLNPILKAVDTAAKGFFTFAAQHAGAIPPPAQKTAASAPAPQKAAPTSVVASTGPVPTQTVSLGAPINSILASYAPTPSLLPQPNIAPADLTNFPGPVVADANTSGTLPSSAPTKVAASVSPPPSQAAPHQILPSSVAPVITSAANPQDQSRIGKAVSRIESAVAGMFGIKAPAPTGSAPVTAPPQPAFDANPFFTPVSGELAPPKFVVPSIEELAKPVEAGTVPQYAVPSVEENAQNVAPVAAPAPPRFVVPSVEELVNPVYVSNHNIFPGTVSSVPYTPAQTRALIKQLDLTSVGSIKVDPTMAAAVLPPSPVPYPQTLPPQSNPLLSTPIKDLTNAQIVQIINTSANAIQNYWAGVYRANGGQYRPAQIVIIDSATEEVVQGAQGTGNSFLGANGNVQIDLQQIRLGRYGFSGATGIMIAETVGHEIGHYVARVTGEDIQASQQSIYNNVQPTLSATTGYDLDTVEELQADYLSGVALKGSGLLGSGDPQQLYYYVASKGDDVLRVGDGQSPTVRPYTHGTATDRAESFYQGLMTGNVDAGLAMLGVTPNWQFVNASVPWGQVTFTNLTASVEATQVSSTNPAPVVATAPTTPPPVITASIPAIPPTPATIPQATTPGITVATNPYNSIFPPTTHAPSQTTPQIAINNIPQAVASFAPAPSGLAPQAFNVPPIAPSASVESPIQSPFPAFTHESIAKAFPTAPVTVAQATPPPTPVKAANPPAKTVATPSPKTPVALPINVRPVIDLRSSQEIADQIAALQSKASQLQAQSAEAQKLLPAAQSKLGAANKISTAITNAQGKVGNAEAAVAALRSAVANLGATDAEKATIKYGVQAASALSGDLAAIPGGESYVGDVQSYLAQAASLEASPSLGGARATASAGDRLASQISGFLKTARAANKPAVDAAQVEVVTLQNQITSANQVLKQIQSLQAAESAAEKAEAQEKLYQAEAQQAVVEATARINQIDAEVNTEDFKNSLVLTPPPAASITPKSLVNDIIAMADDAIFGQIPERVVALEDITVGNSAGPEGKVPAPVWSPEISEAIAPPALGSFPAPTQTAASLAPPEAAAESAASVPQPLPSPAPAPSSPAPISSYFYGIPLPRSRAGGTGSLPAQTNVENSTPPPPVPKLPTAQPAPASTVQDNSGSPVQEIPVVPNSANGVTNGSSINTNVANNNVPAWYREWSAFVQRAQEDILPLIGATPNTSTSLATTNSVPAVATAPSAASIPNTPYIQLSTPSSAQPPAEGQTQGNAQAGVNSAPINGIESPTLDLVKNANGVYELAETEQPVAGSNTVNAPYQNSILEIPPLTNPTSSANTSEPQTPPVTTPTPSTNTTAFSGATPAQHALIEKIGTITSGKVGFFSPTSDPDDVLNEKGISSELTAPTLAQYQRLLTEVAEETAKYPTSFWQNAVPVRIASFVTVPDSAITNSGGVVFDATTNTPRLVDGAATMWINPANSSITIAKTFQHEFEHAEDSLFPSNEIWGQTVYGRNYTNSYGIPPSNTLQNPTYNRSERPSGFVSDYGYVYGPEEDKATTVEMMFTNYPAIEQAAAQEPALAAKVQMIKNAFNAASNGVMDDSYWNDLIPIDSNAELVPVIGSVSPAVPQDPFVPSTDQSFSANTSVPQVAANPTPVLAEPTNTPNPDNVFYGLIRTPYSVESISVPAWYQSWSAFAQNAEESVLTAVGEAPKTPAPQAAINPLPVTTGVSTVAATPPVSNPASEPVQLELPLTQRQPEPVQLTLPLNEPAQPARPAAAYVEPQQLPLPLLEGQQLELPFNQLSQPSQPSQPLSLTLRQLVGKWLSAGLSLFKNLVSPSTPTPPGSTPSTPSSGGSNFSGDNGGINGGNTGNSSSGNSPSPIPPKNDKNNNNDNNNNNPTPPKPPSNKDDDNLSNPPKPPDEKTPSAPPKGPATPPVPPTPPNSTKVTPPASPPTSAAGSQTGSKTGGSGGGLFGALGQLLGLGAQQAAQSLAQPALTPIMTPQLSCSPANVPAATPTPVTISWSCLYGTPIATGFSTGGTQVGQTTFQPPANATSPLQFSLTCVDPTGVQPTPAPAMCSVGVSGQQGTPAVTLVANPTSVPNGGTSQLSWSSVGTTGCEVTLPDGTQIGSSAPNGSAFSPQLSATTIFTALCQDSVTVGTVSATTSVTVQ